MSDEIKEYYRNLTMKIETVAERIYGMASSNIGFQLTLQCTNPIDEKKIPVYTNSFFGKKEIGNLLTYLHEGRECCIYDFKGLFMGIPLFFPYDERIKDVINGVYSSIGEESADTTHTYFMVCDKCKQNYTTDKIYGRYKCPNCGSMQTTEGKTVEVLEADGKNVDNLLKIAEITIKDIEAKDTSLIAFTKMVCGECDEVYETRTDEETARYCKCGNDRAANIDERLKDFAIYYQCEKSDWIHTGIIGGSFPTECKKCRSKDLVKGQTVETTLVEGNGPCYDADGNPDQPSPEPKYTVVPEKIKFTCGDCGIVYEVDDPENPHRWCICGNDRAGNQDERYDGSPKETIK